MKKNFNLAVAFCLFLL